MSKTSVENIIVASESPGLYAVPGFVMIVAVTTPAEVRAAKLELQLAKGDNTLESMEATGTVSAVVEKRTVTGARLTYSPTDDKYMVFGAPVKMVDADCQETSGKTLTFWKASDRVVVDGNNEVRVLTKGGGKCVAAPPR